MATILNLTPHPIRVYQGENIIEFLPTGIIPRCAETQTPAEPIKSGSNTFEIVFTVAGRVDPIPVIREGVYLIVSTQIADNLRRPDLIVPDGVIRDDKGNIKGCTRFKMIL